MRSLCFVVALASLLVACDKDKSSTAPGAGNGLAIVPVPYGANSNVGGEAKERCKFDDDLNEALVDAIPGSTLSSSAAADSRLVAEVTRITGAEPEWEGAITVIVEGQLERNGEEYRFRVKRASLGGVFGGMGAVCRGLDDLATTIAEDLAQFVAKPSKNAELGDKE